jgi:hypothetical protein
MTMHFSFTALMSAPNDELMQELHSTIADKLAAATIANGAWALRCYVALL